MGLEGCTKRIQYIDNFKHMEYPGQCKTTLRLFPDCDYDSTHWGRVTHICVSKLTIIGSDNSLMSSRCQAIIWTNAGIFLMSYIFIKNAFEQVICKMMAILYRAQCVKYIYFYVLGSCCSMSQKVGSAHFSVSGKIFPKGYSSKFDYLP